ncbi:MAG: hypothetical protein CL693_14330 [Cellvibrionaceae bacterium]|nr:hypothetical protein [Cellvibrionaceae bacterium]
MNYLAHVLLSGADPQWQLGGFLGDFIKGPLPALDESYPSESLSQSVLDAQGSPWAKPVLQGVMLHRQLDVFTDSHPIYKQCVAMLGTRHRRFASIALDVFLDHLLARHWSEFHHHSLDHFSHQFYDFCRERSAALPRRAEGFMRAASEHHLFAGYGRWQVFEQVLVRIDQRIRFDSNLSEVGDEIGRHYDELSILLLMFLSEAQKSAEKKRLLIAGIKAV